MKKRELITPHVNARAHTRLLYPRSSALTYVSTQFCGPVRKMEMFNCLVPLLASVQAYPPTVRAEYDPRYTSTVLVCNMHTYGCVMIQSLQS
jgi:hypothetical protein